MEDLTNRFERTVLLTQEVAVRGDCVRVMVLVVDAIPKIKRAFIVYLAQRDWPRGPHERRQALADCFEPAIGFFQKGNARVARHGEGERRYGQHHGLTAR